MPILQQFEEPNAHEAEENLKMIRNLMERSTQYSTFSGLSGVFAGLVSIVGCLVTQAMGKVDDRPIEFIVTWAIVILVAVGADYLLTKRRAAEVGKRVLSRLGRQMVIAAIPGLGSGSLLTFYFMQHKMLANIFPVWMLAYGIAVCATGLFSQREVSALGAAFLVAGAFSLLLPVSGLLMMAITFGGFHIVYALVMSKKEGW